MTILWDAFTPWTALAGGLLIGLSVALMIVLLGRITGISGIVAGLQQTDGRSWRIAFITGLLAAPLLWQLLAPLPAVEMPGNTVVVIVAGLLVGFGTRLGSGCTSGHGVCGLSRLSLRSLAATLTFITTGATTVFIMRYVWV